MHKRQGFLVVALFAALTVLLSACSSSSDTASFNSSAYHFFTGSPTGLTAVDPASTPTNTVIITVETGTVRGITPVEYAQYDAASQKVTARHNRTIIYGTPASGHLYKLDALKGSSLTPVQLSLESGVTGTGICDYWSVPDYADHNNARYIYALPGADSVCNNSDDAYKMVKVGMSETDAPISMGTSTSVYIITVLRNMATGGISGWLNMEDSGLYRYDADFGTKTLVTSAYTDAIAAATAPDDRVFLLLNDAGNDVLKLYDPANNTLSASLHDFVDLARYPVSDDTYLYFQDEADVYKIALDGSGTATVLSGLDAEYYWDNLYIFMVLTDNALVTTVTNSVGDYRIISMPLSGATATFITPADATPVLPVATAGRRIFFEGPSALGSVLDDGTGLVDRSDLAGVGFVSSPEQRLAMIDQQAEGLSGVFAMMHVASTIETSATGTVMSYDATSYAPTSVSVLPAGVSSLVFWGLSNDNSVLMTADTSDLYLLNLKTDDSLVQITDSPGISKYIVGEVGCSTYNPRGAYDPVLALMIFISIAYLVKRRHA